MGKWGKYLKHYNTQWEKDPQFKNWLKAASENDVLKGKQEAYCTLCEKFLRAHRHDLIVHKNTILHKQKEQSINKKEQPNLHEYGCFKVSDTNKITELKIAMYIATHCSVKNIDHLAVLLKELGKGSQLETIKIHRTKCSKLISSVIAPEFLRELVEDIGTFPYALIVDEATDISVTKFMGICVRYFSEKRAEYVTDFLGLVQLTNCTGSALADATKAYLKSVGLPLQNLHSVGTDGASAMIGEHNSFYTHMKKEIPNLILFKCICHSLDKCAEYAFKKIPNEVQFILSQIHNWFAHSAKRWDEYVQYYKTINDGRPPKKIPALSKTRWLIWLPVSEVILEQWNELQGFFGLQKKDYLASELVQLINDKVNKLYLIMIKTMLMGVEKVNFAFQHTTADITKLYSDLRRLIFSLASRILKEQAIAETSRPNVIRMDELQMLKAALADSTNHRPPDVLLLGDSFTQLLSVTKLNDERRDILYKTCGQYVLCLCNQLIERMPSNLPAIEKLKFLSPHLVFTKVGKPLFQQLPIELIDSSMKKDLIESQWLELGMASLSDICSHTELHSDIRNMDINHFWSCVLSCKNAVGEQPFKELALFAIKVLTLPISNAVVERVFSVMSCIKDKRRNKLQISMLEALLRMRIHIKVDGKCCKDFQPTKAMLSRFNSTMYSNQEGISNSTTKNEDTTNDLEEDDYNDLITIFDTNGDHCVLNV